MLVAVAFSNRSRLSCLGMDQGCGMEQQVLALKAQVAALSAQLADAKKSSRCRSSGNSNNGGNRSSGGGDGAVAEAGVRVVVQRAEAVEVLLDNDAQWARCGRCLVIFVSFAKGATAAALPKVVQTLLRIPVATLGQWVTHTQTAKKKKKREKKVEMATAMAATPAPHAAAQQDVAAAAPLEAESAPGATAPLEQAPRSILSFVEEAYRAEVEVDRAMRARGARVPPREPRPRRDAAVAEQQQSVAATAAGHDRDRRRFLRFLHDHVGSGVPPTRGSGPRCPISIVVIPQAGLTSKIAPTGRELKYHAQADKALSEALYGEFVSLLRLQTRAAVGRGVPPPRTGAALGAEFERRRADREATACIDPAKMFQPTVAAGGAPAFAGKFGAWDSTTGLPTHDAQGEPLAKSQLKKLAKVQKVQASKFARAAAARAQGSIGDGGGGSAAVAAPPLAQQATVEVPVEAVLPPPAALADAEEDDVVRVIAGTFGNRQGFKMTAECGPFVHTFSF